MRANVLFLVLLVLCASCFVDAGGSREADIWQFEKLARSQGLPWPEPGESRVERTAEGGWRITAPGPRRSGFATEVKKRVELVAGATAGEPFSIVTGDKKAEVSRQSASKAVATLDNGSLLYTDAFPNVDSRLFSHDSGVIEYLRVREPQAAVSYRLLGTPTGPLPKVLGAFDVDGNRVHACVTSSEGEAKLGLSLSGQNRFPVVLAILWSSTASMAVPRAMHNAVQLSNGKVIVIGGTMDGSTEIFDPQHGSFEAGPSTHYPRLESTSTALNDARILIAGGAQGVSNDVAPTQSTTELYEPASNHFVDGPPMSVPREAHTATITRGGDVALIGGITADYPGGSVGSLGTPLTVTPSIEIYMSGETRFRAAGSLQVSRAFHSATLLRNGKILIVGGIGQEGAVLASAELFDPVTATSSLAGALTARRYGHNAALLPDGRVLISGGDVYSEGTGAEIYDPASDRFSAGHLDLHHQKALFGTLSILPTGDAMFCGGIPVTCSIHANYMIGFMTVSFAAIQCITAEAPTVQRCSRRVGYWSRADSMVLHQLPLRRS